MDKNFVFTVKSTRLDEHYRPAESALTTTNLANLARGPRRKEILCDALSMIDNCFNALMSWDNATADRYSVELDNALDTKTNQRLLDT